MNKNNFILLISLVLIIKESFSQNNPDSIIYITDKWGLTTITTTSMECQEELEYPNPFAPPTPLSLDIEKSCIINMSILDTNGTVLEKYEFSAFFAGAYRIKGWAFYKNLPPGIYKFVLEWLDNSEVYFIVK